MNRVISRFGTRWPMTIVGLALVVIAYLRGEYLFGTCLGVIYAMMAWTYLSFIIAFYPSAEQPARIRRILLAILAVPLGYAMAFPTAIIPKCRIFIDNQAIDRSARAEVRAVFKSDAAYAHLSISTVYHLKGRMVVISGSLPTRGDLRNLVSRIANECPSVRHFGLRWNVFLCDSQQDIPSFDRDLVPPPQETQNK
jgi:hypothetical protein